MHQLRINLSALATDVDATYVLGKAKGVEVEKPSPSRKMSSQAHAAMERAATGKGAHLPALVQALDELKSNAHADRLPSVMKDMGDACKALEAVLWSPEFRSIVGKNFADLPSMVDVAASQSGGMPQLTDSMPQLTNGEKMPSVSKHCTGTPQKRGHELKLAAAHGTPGAAVLEPSPNGHSDKIWAKEPSLSPTIPRIMVRGSPAAAQALETQSQSGPLSAKVQSMVPRSCGGELRAAGCYVVSLDGTRLTLCSAEAPTSRASIDIRSGIEECRLREQVFLSLNVLQPVPGSAPEDGVMDHKTYTFRFDAAPLAAAFNSRLSAHVKPW